MNHLNWQQQLKDMLPALGHRNWIVVADSAYPAQVGPGFYILVTGADHLEVVREVLNMIDEAPHIRARLWMDREFGFLEDDLVPGIETFRSKMEELLRGRRIEHSSHVELLRVLEETGQSYRVVILKTTVTLPYVSLFIELDCGYWTAEKEKVLRQRMVVGKGLS